MLCDICGRKEQQYIAMIEDSTLSVCQACAKFGKVLRKVELESEKQNFKKSEKENKHETLETTVPNFSILIRKKRESMQLNHENFAGKLGIKTSILHKIETGQYSPDIQTVRRMEKILNLKLTEKNEYKGDVKSEKEVKGMTIGDFIKVNRK